jgi:hypothetical protein
MIPEHRIRLRGGWEWHDPDGARPPRRAVLPLDAPPGGPGPIRLVRWFQTPRYDPARESLWLRLENVDGLGRVCLNDREIACGPFGPDPTLLPLGDQLPGRNRLTLDVIPAPRSDASPWGMVALAIRRGVETG